MSILKFMIDDDFFINSNMEYENSCIYGGKIIKPPSEYSKDSENTKNQEINIYIQWLEYIQDNFKNENNEILMSNKKYKFIKYFLLKMEMSIYLPSIDTL